MSNTNLTQLELAPQSEAIDQQPGSVVQQPGAVVQQPGVVVQHPCLFLDMLSGNDVEYCLRFLPIVNFMRICRVGRRFIGYRTVEYVWKHLWNSFCFVSQIKFMFSEALPLASPYKFRVINGQAGRHMSWTADVSTIVNRYNSFAVMETFERRYTLSVEYELVRNAVGLLNNWVRDRIPTLQPLRLAGLFSSRSVRRCLVNHLRRFFTGGAGQMNPVEMQLVCDDEIVGKSRGISAKMELLPEITYDLSQCKVKLQDCPYVQYMGALLTHSYGISYMRIDPIYVAPGEGREVSGFFMDVTRTDVEALNGVFVGLYPAFVAVSFD